MLKQNHLRKIKGALGLIFVIATAGATPLVFALDNDSQGSLEKTQSLLNNSDQRQNAIKGDDKAMKADEAVRALTNGDSKLTGDVYRLASKVLENIVKECDGDSETMQKCMDRFSKDPEGFENTWTDTQKADFKALTEKLGGSSSKINKN